jgi:hypothetical protein
MNGPLSINKIANSMELSPFGEATSCSVTRISQQFVEPDGPLPRSQGLSTGPYPEPNQSSPYHPILPKIHFNIILAPMSRPSQGSFLLAFPSKSYKHSSQHEHTQTNFFTLQPTKCQIRDEAANLKT